MAHFVGKELHINPNEILDTWNTPQLIVAYGQYANEIADRNYREWASLDAKSRGKTERPPKFIVQFIGPDDIDE